MIKRVFNTALIMAALAISLSSCSQSILPLRHNDAAMSSAGTELLSLLCGKATIWHSAASPAAAR